MEAADTPAYKHAILEAVLILKNNQIRMKW